MIGNYAGCQHWYDVEITTLATPLGAAEVVGKMCSKCGSRRLKKSWLHQYRSPTHQKPHKPRRDEN